MKILWTPTGNAVFRYWWRVSNLEIALISINSLLPTEQPPCYKVAPTFSHGFSQFTFRQNSARPFCVPIILHGRETVERKPCTSRKRNEVSVDTSVTSLVPTANIRCFRAQIDCNRLFRSDFYRVRPFRDRCVRRPRQIVRIRNPERREAEIIDF